MTRSTAQPKQTRAKPSKAKPQTEATPTDAAFDAAAAAYEQAGDMFQLITPDGTVTGAGELPDPETRLRLYHQMRRARHFDERGWVLYRQGRLGVFPPFGGMEASQVGTAAALTPDDWLFPTYRDTGAALTLGLPIARTLAYWRTSPHGWAMPENLKVLPFYIPIATQYPHAVGAALAEKRKGTKNVAMAYIGDGGSSEGDFHEALNFAGALEAPCVFILQNNGWAISVPTRTQTKATNLSRRAEGYGIPVEQAYGEARAIMNGVIEGDVRRDIGGDQQRIGEIRTEVGALTFKHVLLPVWLAAYKYNGKSYRFVVNGQSGRVQGDRPYSVWKIAFAVVLALIALAAFLYLAQQGGYIRMGDGFSSSIPVPSDYGLPGGLSPGGGYVIRGY